MLIPIGDNIERRRMPIVPVILIVLNILMFIVEVWLAKTAPSKDFMTGFFATWGLAPEELAEGRIIGVLTYNFLHGSVGHLVINMVFLWAFAGSLERCFGRWTLAGFYMLFSVAGGLLHAGMDMSSDIPLVGASGAVAGLIGAYTVLLGPSSKIRALLFIWFAPIRVSFPAWQFGLGWFGLQILSGLFDTRSGSGVSWCCHIGGFIAGIVLAEVCRYDTDATIVRNRYGRVTMAVSRPESHTNDSASELFKEYELRHQQPKNNIRLTAAEIVATAGDELAPNIGYDIDYETQLGKLPIPSRCPYCFQQLDERNRITFEIAVCDNSGCERMIQMNPEKTGEQTGRPLFDPALAALDGLRDGQTG